MSGVHLSPAVSIACAVPLLVLIAWYWRRLGRPAVPPLRRRLRRTSLALQVLTLPSLVAGLSFVDPAVDRHAYVVVWCIAFALLLLVLLSAVVDAIVSLRLERSTVERVAEDALQRLARAQGDGSGS